MVRVVAVKRVHFVPFLFDREKRGDERFYDRSVPEGVCTYVVFRVPVRSNDGVCVIVAPSGCFVAFLVRFGGVDFQFLAFGGGFKKDSFISTLWWSYGEEEGWITYRPWRRGRRS